MMVNSAVSLLTSSGNLSVWVDFNLLSERCSRIRREAHGPVPAPADRLSSRGLPGFGFLETGSSSFS